MTKVNFIFAPLAVAVGVVAACDMFVGVVCITVAYRNLLI